MRAVDGVSFDLNRGETLGLVGESGCGKSTVGRAIVNILRAMSYGVDISGKIMYHQPSGAVDLAPLSRTQMRPYRTDIQMIFQDPYSSLNPRMTVSADCRGTAEDSHEAMSGRTNAASAWPGCWESRPVGASRRTGIRTSFPAASASASALRGRLRRIRRSSSRTSRSARWMFRFRRR